MTQDFNLKRAILLTKSIFLINKKIIIWGAIICFGVLLTISMLICIKEKIPYGFTFDAITNIAVLGMPIYMLNKYNKSAFINTTYMVPASISEKFLVPFIISLVIIPITLCVIYTIALTLSWVLSLSINTDTVTYIDFILGKNTYIYGTPIDYLLSLFFWHSTGCLLSNPKNIKFFIIYIVIVVLGIISAYRSYYRLDFMGSSEIYGWYAKFEEIMSYILTAVFWSVSYINFKRIETKK